MNNYLTELVASRNFAKKMSYISLFIALVAIGTAAYIYFTSSDVKVVVIAPDGRPYMAKTFEGEKSRITKELSAYLNEVVPLVLSLSYADLVERDAFSRYVNSIRRYFDSKYFAGFFNIFKQSYFVRDIYKKRSVVKVTDMEVIDTKKSGEEFISVVKVKVLSFYTDTNEKGEEIPVRETDNKTYEIRYRIGDRTVLNPYGLYITLFSEIVR